MKIVKTIDAAELKQEIERTAVAMLISGIRRPDDDDHSAMQFTAGEFAALDVLCQHIGVMIGEPFIVEVRPPNSSQEPWRLGETK